MNDKVFWSCFGALVLGWIGCYIFLVSDVRSNALEQEGKVASAVKLMNKYEDKDADKLPTNELAQWHAEQLEADKDTYDRALDFYEDRDGRFESWITGDAKPDEGTWWARYRVEFEKLKSEYVEYASLQETPEEIPFKAEKQDGRLDLEMLNQRWRVQETLIRKAMARGGQIEKYEPGRTKKKRERKGAPKKKKKGEEDETQYFSRASTKIQLRMPPKEVLPYLDELLSDAAIHFEVQQFEMAKRERDLMYEKADAMERDEAGSIPLRAEPVVGVLLTIDALNWVYERKPEEKE